MIASSPISISKSGDMSGALTFVPFSFCTVRKVSFDSWSIKISLITSAYMTLQSWN